ncbi:MAG: hypothetical protein ACQPRJ_00675 [Solitalea-like symbiont of Acarus siro]
MALSKLSGKQQIQYLLFHEGIRYSNKMTNVEPHEQTAFCPYLAPSAGFRIQKSRQSKLNLDYAALVASIGIEPIP